MALANPDELRRNRGSLKSSRRVLVRRPFLLDVFTGEMLEGYNVLILGDYVYQITKREAEAEVRIDAEGKYLCPGFIEGHIHIESSMLLPSEFSKLAVAHGTTLIVADPHEIANVCGIEGVISFMHEAKNSPMRFLFEAPSCVPSTDPFLGLETSGRSLGRKEISSLLSLGYVIGLGEVMDFFSVLSGKARGKLEEAWRRGKIVEGHMPKMPEEVLNLEKFLGIDSCHESTSYEEGIEKLRRGIYLMIREGSAWRDLKAILPRIVKEKIDIRRCTFVSDDLSVIDLVEKGHLDRILREAVSLGMDPIKAIQMVTINPSERLGLSDLFGTISPGSMADFVLLNDLEKFEVTGTFIGGKPFYWEGKWIDWPKKKFSFPSFMLDSVHVRRILSSDDVKIVARGPYAEVRIIEARPGSALTFERSEILPVRGEEVVLRDDLRYVVVLERHHATGNYSVGIVKGIDVEGAIAQTIAHDSHNLIAVGNSKKDIALAIKAVCLLGGGIAYVKEGKVISKVPLEVSGLVSSRSWKEVYEMCKEMYQKFGKNFEAIHLTISLLALPVIPEVRITDCGIVRVEEGRIVKPIIRDFLSPSEAEKEGIEVEGKYV